MIPGVMHSDAGKTDSLWTLPVDATGPEPPLGSNEQANLVVVGAGIAGLTTAYLAAMEGKSVIVLDDGPIGGCTATRVRAWRPRATRLRSTKSNRLSGTKRSTANSNGWTDICFFRPGQILHFSKMRCGRFTLPV